MTANLSLTDREQQVLQHIAYRGEATLEQLATALGVTENSIWRYVTSLAERHVITSRRETWAEVDARMAMYQGPPIPKRSIRRKRLFALVAPELGV